MMEKPYNKGRLTCGTFTKPRHFLLFPDGTVSLCCMDWNLKHILGNLLKDDFKDLYNSEEYKKVLKGFKDETIDIACRNCEWALKALNEVEWKTKVIHNG